ncbi:MAG: TonB-dependent receptor [Caulobacteraceae bacterium]
MAATTSRVRAPNIGELFLGKQEVFGGPTNYGDPCSRLATAPFGANPATNSSGAAGAANTEAICRALMGPAGAAYYYANPQIPGAFSPFGFVNQMGNPNLKPERARTWTAGVVLRSPIQSGWLSRFNASIDWYKISITGAIEFDSVDNVKQACLTLPAAQAIGSFQCSLLARNPILGQEDTTTIVYNNLATIWTSGVDGQLNWGADLSDIGFKNAPGAVNLSVLVNWLDYFDTQSTPGGPTTHWAGTLGPNLAGTDAGAFKYKLNTTLSYAVGPASLSLNWRHLPSIHAQSYGQPGDRGVDTASHDEFGLSGTWTINKNYILRAGVENLFNAEPEITAQTVTTGTPRHAGLPAGQQRRGHDQRRPLRRPRPPLLRRPEGEVLSRTRTRYGLGAGRRVRPFFLRADAWRRRTSRAGRRRRSSWPRALDAQGRHAEAVDCLSRAGRGGNDARALGLLGLRLLTGDRAPFLPAEGARLLGDAAGAGDAEAAGRLAVLIGGGFYARQSWPAALDCLQRSAELGSAFAQTQLRILAGAETTTEPAAPGPLAAAARGAWTSPPWLAVPPSVSLSDSPSVRAVPGLIPPAACAWVISQAQPRLVRAELYDPATRRAGGGPGRRG